MRFGKFDVRYLGTVLALAFILLIIMSVRLGQGTEWWAAWGQWVGGVGSIGAAAVAVWIAIEGWRKSDHELTRAREIEEQSLASKLGVWIGETFGPVQTININMGWVDQSGWYAVKVRNATDTPMYDIAVMVDFGYPDKLYHHRRPVLGPASTEDFELEHGAFQNYLDRVVAHIRETRKGEAHGEIANALADTNTKLDHLYVIERATVRVEFTDGNNTRWRRTTPGKLEKI
ncbi:hypothetical protein [Amycolatopsis sp. Hca4]|uniref:hypothetical protein n=1 Tax=Amycolatopsis sp. Hca4 TaxID=2742131 RepID=UPI0015917D44|nr:hypothetical protein [Amycolatopsis sp. Hca4]QKV74550.1 hypothetical protein HUT10_12790 [Amycolatopsis sp. Hca4]